MPNCGTVGSIEENTNYFAVWKIPKFSSLTANVGNFYASPDMYMFDNIYNLRIYPEGTASIPGFTTMQLSRTYPVFDEYVRFSLITYGTEYSVQDEFIINETLERDACDSNLFLLMKRSTLLKRLKIYNSSSEDVLRLYLSLSFSKTVPTRSNEQRLILSNVELTEDKSTDIAVREYLREQLDAKVSRETQTENVSSDTAVREDLREQLDAKGDDPTLRKHLEDMLLSGNSHDVTIKVKHQQFKAHKCMLQARSPVFAAMFKHKMKESTDDSITIDDCDPESFGEFLHYIYTGKVKNLSLSKAMGLYYAGDKYDFSSLKEICLEFLKTSLTISAIGDVITLAIKHSEDELLECAMAFVAKHLEEIMSSVEWQRFLLDNPIQANEICLKAVKLRSHEK